MMTLSIIHQQPPMQEAVAITARITPKRGDQFYVCNPFDEIIEARDSGEPFVAHTVVGMRPLRVMIEPGTIARIEEV
jgi:hypothetical protein